MTTTMTSKGYAARIDDEDGILTGRIAGIRDRVGFHADTVEDYLETCARTGKDPQRA